MTLQAVDPFPVSVTITDEDTVSAPSLLLQTGCICRSWPVYGGSTLDRRSYIVQPFNVHQEGAKVVRCDSTGGQISARISIS